jgi:enamine deaminase RidA (YjgF/YER057c/UK114 family)
MITVNSELLPKAVGPYSHAKIVKAGENFLFTSGQLGIDP